MPCYENEGSDEYQNGACECCGQPTHDGFTLQKCKYASIICEECENAPCCEGC